MGKLKETFELPADTFKERYEREKPELNTDIIFTCKSGRRAAIAVDQAINLGYTK